MRKTVSILLTLIFFFQSLGCLVFFKLQQLQVRYQVKTHLLSQLPDHALAVIKLSPKEKKHVFGILGDADEFRYSGSMYDVIKKEQHADRTWYYCYPDKEETRIFAQLKRIVNDQMNHNPEKKHRRENIQRLLSSLFFGKHLSPQIVHPFIVLLQSLYSFPLKTWTGSPLTQPPQFA